MNASSRTSSYFMSGSGNSITFQNGPWTWTFGQNIKFTFKFILSPFNKQESYHFHKEIGIWRRHFRWYLVNKTVCCSQMCSTYQKYFGWCQSSTLLLKHIIICHELERERELRSLFCQISWSDWGTQSFFSSWTGAGTKSLFSWTSNTLGWFIIYNYLQTYSASNRLWSKPKLRAVWSYKKPQVWLRFLRNDN